MIIQGAFAREFTILQKVELIDLCAANDSFQISEEFSSKRQENCRLNHLQMEMDLTNFW